MDEHTTQKLIIAFGEHKAEALRDLEALYRRAHAIDDLLTAHWGHQDAAICTAVRDGKARLRGALNLLAGTERSLKDALDAVSADLKRAPSRAVAHPDAPATWSPTERAAAAGGVIG